MEKFNCSIDEINALKLLYYNALYGFHHLKGLRYKQALTVIKNIKKIIPDTKKCNIDDLLVIYDDSGVFKNENEFNS